MKTTPTGRIISGENYQRQQEAAYHIHHRMTEAMLSVPGVETIGPDAYDITKADYALIEQRIMAAMKEDDEKA